MEQISNQLRAEIRQIVCEELDNGALDTAQAKASRLLETLEKIIETLEKMKTLVTIIGLIDSVTEGHPVRKACGIGSAEDSAPPKSSAGVAPP